MTNVLGVTLARGGSKGIKNKNLVKIKGKPLIFYTIKEARKTKEITNYIVSTDSNKIKKELKWYPKINFSKGLGLTLDWYFENKSYYKTLSKKDILNRLGKKWLKEELF